MIALDVTNERPSWVEELKYRRHPDDIKAESGNWVEVPDHLIFMPEEIACLEQIKVQVEYRSGAVSGPMPPNCFYWENPASHSARIIAYRIFND